MGSRKVGSAPQREEKVLKILAISAAAVALMATPALAQGSTGAYANLGYTQYDTHNSTLGGVTGRLGYNFSPNVGGEVEYTGGVNDDTNAKLRDSYGAYAVGRVPLSDRFSLFGRVGYNKINIDGRNGFADRHEDGIAGGVGAEYQATSGLGIRGQYTRLGGNADANAWELAGVAHF